MAKRNPATAQEALDGLKLTTQNREAILNAIGLIGDARHGFGGNKKRPIVSGGRGGDRERAAKAIRGIRDSLAVLESVQRDTGFLYPATLDGATGAHALAAMQASAQIEAVLRELPAVNLPYVLAIVAQRLEAALKRAKRVNVVNAERMWVADMVDKLIETKGRPCYREAASFVSWATGYTWTERDVQACWKNRRPEQADKQPPQK